jgi:FtsZ-interacting cell division protein ZipA
VTTTALVLLIIAVAAIVLAGLMAWKLRRSQKIRSRFGPEYERTVQQRGSAAKAERELEHRARRVEKFRIRSLTPDESDQFAARWRSAQARFVDDPRGAVAEASELLHGVMRARGYPAGGDFEEQASDLSVNYPRLVEHYRIAHTIATRDAHDPVSTEDLRAAMNHYRTLFEDLLERRVSELNEVRR